MTQPLSADKAKTTVLAFIEAMNKEDFNKAREYVNEDMNFIGVLGTRHGAAAYFEDMKKMKFKYDIKKAFADGDDVCLLYDIDMGKTTIFTCGWYQLTGGKISTLKVIFDPRPVLEAK